ncbi:hypothetical protein I3760_16G095200 [Carya illinoinensis]|nr:hypothetical protein I3760_16G095200 [Carya illinoinensis]
MILRLPRSKPSKPSPLHHDLSSRFLSPPKQRPQSTQREAALSPPTRISQICRRVNNL